MTDPELLHKARQLALELISKYVDRGDSYDDLRKSGMGHSGSDGWVSIGGWIPGDPPTPIPSTKIVVNKVDDVTVNQVFSLKELFDECKEGQLRLV